MNDLTSWDNYSDDSEEENDRSEGNVVNETTKQLFLKKYAASKFEVNYIFIKSFIGKRAFANFH
jgi:hypothetical protein